MNELVIKWQINMIAMMIKTTMSQMITQKKIKELNNFNSSLCGNEEDRRDRKIERKIQISPIQILMKKIFTNKKKEVEEDQKDQKIRRISRNLKDR